MLEFKLIHISKRTKTLSLDHTVTIFSANRNKSGLVAKIAKGVVFRRSSFWFWQKFRFTEVVEAQQMF